MKIDDLKQAKDQRPFQPFWVHMADGREVEVRHPDALAWRDDRARSVAYVSPKGDWMWIDVALVTALRIPASQPQAQGNGG
jgi:hypothetical protein